MSRKGSPERLTSSNRIATSLENTPKNRAIMRNEPIKTSLGHWKSKLIESGLLGEIKEGEDPRTYYSEVSKKADDFLKKLLKRVRGMPEKYGMLNKDGSPNLDYVFGGDMFGQFGIEMTRMFTNELVNEAITRYGLSDIGAKIREARKGQTFKDLRATIMNVVPKEVLDMTVYGKNKLGPSLIDDVLPARLFNERDGSEAMFGGEDEWGNGLLETVVPDEKLGEIDSGLKDLLSSNYEYEHAAQEKSRQLLGLIIPLGEERDRVFDSIGIKQRE